MLTFPALDGACERCILTIMPLPFLLALKCLDHAQFAAGKHGINQPLLSDLWIELVDLGLGQIAQRFLQHKHHDGKPFSMLR